MAAVFRRVIAGLILGPALLIGSFAWWGFLSLRTVFDENRTPTIAEELLDNEAVIDQIGANMGKALEAAMPDSIQLSEEEVSAAVAIILNDPVVRDLMIESLGTTHRAFLGLDDAPSTIDLGPALASSQERIGVFLPRIAAQIPDEFVVELPTERIPDASPVKRFLERSMPLLAGISLTMALLAFLTTSDRSRVLGKAARWAIGTTIFYLVVGLGAPYLLREFAPDQGEILAAFLAAILRAALIPSVVLGSIGVILLLLSMFWPDGDRRRPRDRNRGAERPPEPASASRPVPRPAPQPAAQPATRPTPAAVPHTPAPTAPVGGADATAAMPVAPVAPMATPAPPPVSAPPRFVARPRPPVAAHPMPEASRPVLPTRAKPPDSTGPPAWTGEPSPIPKPEAQKPSWLPPKWVEGHGWVMDPDDSREPPNNARHVEGVGWVVPGPRPADGA